MGVDHEPERADKKSASDSGEFHCEFNMEEKDTGFRAEGSICKGPRVKDHAVRGDGERHFVVRGVEDAEILLPPEIADLLPPSEAERGEVFVCERCGLKTEIAETHGAAVALVILH